MIHGIDISGDIRSLHCTDRIDSDSDPTRLDSDSDSDSGSDSGSPIPTPVRRSSPVAQQVAWVAPDDPSDPPYHLTQPFHLVTDSGVRPAQPGSTATPTHTEEFWRARIGTPPPPAPRQGRGRDSKTQKCRIIGQRPRLTGHAAFRPLSACRRNRLPT